MDGTVGKRVGENATQLCELRAQYHGELAMKAARRMRHTRQKQQTGHLVCHHLKMMLEEAARAANESSVDDDSVMLFQRGG